MVTSDGVGLLGAWILLAILATAVRSDDCSTKDSDYCEVRLPFEFIDSCRAFAAQIHVETPLAWSLVCLLHDHIRKLTERLS